MTDQTILQMEKIISIEDIMSVWMCIDIVDIGFFTTENPLTQLSF